MGRKSYDICTVMRLHMGRNVLKWSELTRVVVTVTPFLFVCLLVCCLKGCKNRKGTSAKWFRLMILVVRDKFSKLPRSEVLSNYPSISWRLKRGRYWRKKKTWYQTYTNNIMSHLRFRMNYFGSSTGQKYSKVIYQIFYRETYCKIIHI